MTALRALVSGLAWWATWALATRSTGSVAGIGLASVVAGALAGGALRGALLSLVLVVAGSAAGILRWSDAANAVQHRGWLESGGIVEAFAPFAVPLALAVLAGIVASRASPAGRPGMLPAKASPDGAASIGALVDTRPDLVLRVRALRKDWAGAAQLAEELGMPRSAARWWRAAGELERARNVATGPAAANLELAERPGRHGAPSEPAPLLEIEDPRAARFTIDSPDDET